MTARTWACPARGGDFLDRRGEPFRRGRVRGDRAFVADHGARSPDGSPPRPMAGQPGKRPCFALQGTLVIAASFGR